MWSASANAIRSGNEPHRVECCPSEGRLSSPMSIAKLRVDFIEREPAGASSHDAALRLSSRTDKMHRASLNLLQCAMRMGEH